MHEIFVVKTDDFEEHSYEKLLEILPDTEKSKILPKRNGINSLIGALLVRYAVKKTFGIPMKKIEILREKSDKPYLKDYDNIHISISHSQNVVVCAVSDKPVGVDIEKIRPVSSGVMKRTCSENELNEILKNSDPVSSFINTWTKKEAILKRKGTGITDKEIKKCLENEKLFSTMYDNFWISCTL